MNERVFHWKCEPSLPSKVMGLFFSGLADDLWPCSLTFDGLQHQHCALRYVKVLEEKNQEVHYNSAKHAFLKKGQEYALEVGKIRDITLQWPVFVTSPHCCPSSRPRKRSWFASDSAGLFPSFLSWEGLCVFDIFALIMTKGESRCQTQSRKSKAKVTRKECTFAKTKKEANWKENQRTVQFVRKRVGGVVNP